MSITAVPDAATRLARVLPPPSHPDPTTRLPLRTELFLIAHDDDTGRPHRDPRRLETALAGAVLLELWLARRIQIGWRYDARTGRWLRDPGRITVLREDPLGDPLADTALTTLRYSTMRVGEFVARFAATGLYERVRADMIATGVLRRDVRRRFGLFRRERHLPVHPAHAVRTRTRIRVLAAQHRSVVDGVRRLREVTSGAVEVAPPPEPRADHRVDDHAIALSALLTGMGLTPYLYPPDTTPHRLHQRLVHIVDARDDGTLSNVIKTINPAA